VSIAVRRPCSDFMDMLRRLINYRIIIIRDDNDMYRIAVRAGVLRGKYSRNQFDLCVQKLLSGTDVKQMRKLR